MTTMVAEVYDALIEAGASEDKARKAAGVLANYDDQFVDIRSDLKVLKWQVGVLTAAMLLLGAPAVWLLVRVAAKVGAIKTEPGMCSAG